MMLLGRIASSSTVQRSWGESLIDGQGGVTAIPHRPQRVDERRPARKVEGDETAGHARQIVTGSIGVKRPTAASISAAMVRQRRSV